MEIYELTSDSLITKVSAMIDDPMKLILHDHPLPPLIRYTIAPLSICSVDTQAESERIEKELRALISNYRHTHLSVGKLHLNQL